MTAELLRLISLRFLALWCGFCLGVGADMVRVYVLPDDELGTNYRLSQLRPDLANWWQPPHVMRVGVTPPPTAKIWQRGDCLPNPLVLLIKLDADERIVLNRQDFGTASETTALRAKLAAIFQIRLEAKIYRREVYAFDDGVMYSPIRGKEKAALSEFDKVERTVFLQADRRLDYGVVAKLIDDLQAAGASPVILQIDERLPPPWLMEIDVVTIYETVEPVSEVRKPLRRKQRAR